MLLDVYTAAGSNGWLGAFEEFVNKVKSTRPTVIDLIDIIIVALAIFYLLTRLKSNKFKHLISGLIILGVGYALVTLLGFTVSTYILKFVFSNIFIILVIVFQQEIRQIIERIGRSRFVGGSLFELFASEKSETVTKAIIEISKAVQRMSESKTGALIVMEKGTLPLEVVESGISVDAEISHELIGNIFYPKSPLHDGAAIVRDGRLFKAGCVLPLTHSNNVPSELGTRHRAAIGMSEYSDAMIVVVSEETGNISVVVNGRLQSGYDESSLRAAMLDYMTEDSSGKKDNKISGFFKKGRKK